MPVTVRYMRYFCPEEESFDTLDEAMRFTMRLNDYGEGFVEEVVGTDGTVYDLDQMMDYWLQEGQH